MGVSGVVFHRKYQMHTFQKKATMYHTEHRGSEGRNVQSSVGNVISFLDVRPNPCVQEIIAK